MSSDRLIALGVAVVLASIYLDLVLFRPLRRIHEDLQVIIAFLRNRQ